MLAAPAAPWAPPEDTDALDTLLNELWDPNELLDGSADALWPSASEPPQATLSGGWRCINGAHAQPCSICFPAPSASEEAAYELVGETPAQNGVKALRALVVATEEWRDGCARTAAAEEWERSGDALAALAPALRACAASKLRRAHLLALARRWRLASNHWRRKARARAARAPPPPTLALAPQQPQPPLALQPPQLCAVAFAAWTRQLLPTCAALAAPLDGTAECAALTARGAAAAHVSAPQLAEFRELAAFGRRAVTLFQQQVAAAEAARSHALLSPTAAATPAWTVLPPNGLALEELIRLANAACIAAVPPCAPDATDLERAAAAKLRDAVVAAGDLDYRVLGALAQMRTAPLPEFFAALTAAAQFWAAAGEDWAAAFERRLSWMTQLAAEQQQQQQPVAHTRPLLFRLPPAQLPALEAAMSAMEQECMALRVA